MKMDVEKPDSRIAAGLVMEGKRDETYAVMKICGPGAILREKGGCNTWVKFGTTCDDSGRRL